MKLMGILNVTPDSFYDGGKYSGVDSALDHAHQMVQEGADYIDVGGESTRPGSRPVPLKEELKRVVPIVKKLIRSFPKIPVSIDTQKSQVAYQALNEGAQIINDVSALQTDPLMLPAIKKFKATVVLMHKQGSPQTMQKSPRYKNVTAEVKRMLMHRIQWAVNHGINKKKIWIDPGIGFGKTVQHNLELISRIKEFVRLGYPVLLGTSRKSFIGILNGSRDNPLKPEHRLEGSLATACWAFLKGVSILRVHDVGATRKALQVLSSLEFRV